MPCNYNKDLCKVEERRRRRPERREATGLQQNSRAGRNIWTDLVR